MEPLPRLDAEDVVGKELPALVADKSKGVQDKVQLNIFKEQLNQELYKKKIIASSSVANHGMSIWTKPGTMTPKGRFWRRGKNPASCP